MKVFTKKNHGLSIVELLVALFIFGTTTVVTTKISDTKNQMIAKTSTENQSREIEHAAIAKIQEIGIEIIKSGKCDDQLKLNNEFGKKHYRIKFENLTVKEKKSLPDEMQKRCRDTIYVGSKKFSFCKKITASKEAIKSLWPNAKNASYKLVVIEGAYFYKQNPVYAQSTTCATIKNNKNKDNFANHPWGGDFYYSLATIKRSELKKGQKMTFRRNYRYLPADDEGL